MTANNPKRCDIQIEPGRTIKLVPRPNKEQLNDQQLADYREQRHAFIQWLRREGKNPDAYEGYSDYSTYGTAYRTAAFDRWVWTERDRYVMPPRPEHADEYIEHVAYRDVSSSTKGKIEEALTRYFRWIDATGGSEWDHDQQFNSSGVDSPSDYITRRERRLLRTAALDTGDWREASLVAVSLDAGLRPVEVRRASIEWVDTQNRLLRIPREDSSKNIDNWRVSLTDRAATALDKWLDERSRIEMYDESDAIWLTREGTRYSSRSLARLLRRLCEKAGIETGGRSLSWYSIRHHVGTYVSHERGLKAAKDQLRHKSAATTMKYDQVPPDARREALDNI